MVHAEFSLAFIFSHWKKQKCGSTSIQTGRVRGELSEVLISRVFVDVKEVVSRLKEWKCVLVGHHENIGKVIEEWEKQGWRLHTYQTAGMGGAINYTVNHYLLFEKEV